MDEFQCKLNSQPHRVSTVNVRALLFKEWDPISWKGDLWEDSSKVGDIKPLNPGESSLPMEEASPLPVEAASTFSV